MKLTTILAAAFVTGLAPAAWAQATASAAGGVEITQPAGIEVTGEVIFEDIVIAPTMPAPVVTSEGSANVTVVGAQGDAVSLAVPQTFEVVSAETARVVTVMTTADGDYAAISGLQTLLASGGLLSVDVGGAIQVRPDQLAPGEYRGLLVVVAQYN